MRSYIFTERERRIIRGFLDGDVPRNDPGIQQLQSRVKSFTELSGDVDLYLKFREAMSTTST